MSVDNVIGLVLAVAALGYLVDVLPHPERLEASGSNWLQLLALLALLALATRLLGPYLAGVLRAQARCPVRAFSTPAWRDPHLRHRSEP